MALRERPAGGWQKLWAWLADPKWTSLEVVKVAVIPVAIFLVGLQFNVQQKAIEARRLAEEVVERHQNRNEDIEKSRRDAVYAELTAYGDVLVDLQAKSAELIEAHRSLERLERLEQEAVAQGMDTARVDRAEERLDGALAAFDTASNLTDVRLSQLFRKVQPGPVPEAVGDARRVAYNSAVELRSCGLAHRSRLRGGAGIEANSCEDLIVRIMACTNVVVNYSTEAIEMLREAPLETVAVEVDPKMQACRAH